MPLFAPIRSRWTLSGRATLSLSLAIGVLFCVIGVVSYQDARHRALAGALARLNSYNLEVVTDQEHRFERIALAHAHATELLEGELGAGSRADAAALFDALYPRFGDGTRRSTSGLFDGTMTPFGYVRGIGAFIGREPMDQERDRLLAATRVVHAIGEGARPDLKSMAFFTPRDSLVMFAPDRSDGLLYYRRDAPASLSFKGREFLEITLPGNNPSGETRCTSLRPILYDASRRTWTTGCMTPVYIGGRYLGAWGTSLLLDDLLRSGHFSGLASAHTILVSREGRLIVHPRYTRQNSSATERFLDLKTTRDPELRALWSFMRRQTSRRSTTAFIPDLQVYVALRTIPTPGWFALTVQSRNIIEADASRALIRIAISAFACMLVVALILYFSLRNQIAKPLQKLTKRSAELADAFSRIVDSPETIEDQTRNEVRQMELHFAAMADQILAARDILEDRVTERTEALERANEELRLLAHRDPLTGLANRRKLVFDFKKMTTPISGIGTGAFLLFDVDHFKSINDRHGHDAGDQVLVAIGTMASALMRDSDTVARIGGEEFAVLLPNVSMEVAARVAERLRATLAKANVKTGGTTIQFTVSIGLAEIGFGDNLECVQRRADDALYRAKRAGRDRVMQADQQASEEIAGQLRSCA